MSRTGPRAIGILAGGGSLPREIAASIKNRGAEPVIIAIDGEGDASLADLGAIFVNWGKIGRIVREFKRRGCRQIVIVGSVTRPDLGTIKPDLGFFQAAATIIGLVRAGGDDAILRGVIAFFEKKGLAVIGPASLSPEMLIGPGSYAAVSASPEHNADIERGFALIRALAPFDVGQAVVVTDGAIEAIEGNEGTDRMLERVASQRKVGHHDGDSQTHGCLIKRPKPGQELRVDLPVIGPQTVNRVLEANLSGIAVEAGKVLAAERLDMKARAERHDIFIEGVDAAALDGKSPTLSIERYEASRLGRRKITRADQKDATKGAQIADALEPFSCGRAIVIARGHVLAIEAGDGPLATVKRSSVLRQWGDRRWTKRSGLVVLSLGREADAELVDAIAAAGFAGLAIRLTKFSAPVGQSIVEQANQQGLYIAALAPVG